MSKHLNIKTFEDIKKTLRCDDKKAIQIANQLGIKIPTQQIIEKIEPKTKNYELEMLKLILSIFDNEMIFNTKNKIGNFIVTPKDGREQHDEGVMIEHQNEIAYFYKPDIWVSRFCNGKRPNEINKTLIKHGILKQDSHGNSTISIRHHKNQKSKNKRIKNRYYAIRIKTLRDSILTMEQKA